MKFLILVILPLIALNSFASQRLGKCEAEELKRGCYNTADLWCDPFNVTDACVFQCYCEPEPKKRYPVCTYRNQEGQDFISSGTTLQQACIRAEYYCKAQRSNVCTLVP